ncbi:PIN domain-containing protein [Treponema primitia]|uniref:PIN domain-containing protein n=1 Tax=Treponema primitia TaxID=88058 RepID=UPI0002555495|nr:PIN domain-containing protein [Treponema primitia]
MAIPRYVLDSTVIINQLNSKVDIDAFFDTLPEYERYISGVTEIEALSKPGMTEADINEVNTFLLKFNKVNLLPAIKNTAAAIRRGTKMLTPDAIISATAIVLGAICLSNDDHLLKLV